MTENNNPEINVQDLMAQIRHEVSQKKAPVSENNAKLTQYIHEGIVLNRISENKNCIADKPKYTLAEFLEYQDADFIRSAYRGVLRREPDASGYDHYGNLLYTGKMSKIEILGRLRFSAEGRFCRVPVHGLLKPFLARTAFRMPVLGTAAAIASAVVKLPNIVRNQVSFENYTYRHQREHVEQINVIAEQIEGAIAQIQKSFVSLAQTIDTQAISIEDANRRLQGLTLAFDTKADNDQLIKLTNHLVNLVQAKVDAVQLEAHKAENEAQLQSINLALNSKADAAELATTSELLLAELEQKAGISELAAHKAESEAQLQSINLALNNKADAAELATTSELLLAELEQKAGVSELAAHKAESEAQLQNLNIALATKVDTAVKSLTLALDTKADNEQLTKLSNHLVNLVQVKADAVQIEAHKAESEAQLQSLNLALDSKADAAELATTSELLLAELEQKAGISELAAHKAENETQLQSLNLALDSKADDAELATTSELLLAELEQKAGVSELATHKAESDTQLQNLNIALATKVDTTLKSLTLALDTKADNEQLSEMNNQLVELIQAKVDTTELATNREHLLSAIAEKTSATEQDLQDIKRQIHDQKHNLLDQHRRLAILLEEARKRLPKPLSNKQLSNMVAEEDHLLDAFYVSFEDKFRGTRADIKERATVYLPAINLAKAGTAVASILDIGCGRGEWLELLKENELQAQGVDSNHVMVSQCEELGLAVINADAIDYLRTVKSNTLGAVTGMHIIEHIPFKRLIALFDEVLRVLKPGGVAIFETPNPENLIVGACNFYYDPTHLNPLPPEPMRFVLEARGFGSIEIMRLHPNSDAMIKEGAAQVQAVLNEMMFGPQDYALVAYKN